MILLLITYLAGVLTILSPCILPVLPFLFSKSDGPFLKNGLPLLLGMSVSFSLFSALAIAGGAWIGQINEVGRVIALLLLSLLGLSLIYPHLTEKLLAPISRLGSRIGNNPLDKSYRASFLIGVSTGLLWAPCAGPILGLVLTGAAIQGNIFRSLTLLFSYSLGAITSLSIALMAGNRFLGTLKKYLGWDQIVKRILGIGVLIGVFAIVFNLDRTLLTQISKFETMSIENKLLSLLEGKKEKVVNNSMMMMSAKENKQVITEGELPELTGAVAWINSKPLLREDLLGKVVLIDFWTYSCINCLRTLPYLKAWAEKYKNDDFIIIGVHTPEFPFEKSTKNVQETIKDLGIKYPVLVDSDYKIWNTFGNRYWPAHYFIDRQGRIRHHHFGEGEYEESEKIIRELLTEHGGALQAKDLAVEANGIQSASLLQEVKSPETYLGYQRAKNYMGTEMLHDKVANYYAAKQLPLNQWTLDGNWLITAENALVKKAGAKIQFKFHARDLHLVLGSLKKAKNRLRFKVRIDGHAPGADHGLDIDAEGNGEINSHRLYQLIRQKDSNSIGDHLFEIEFNSEDIAVYAFTFG